MAFQGIFAVVCVSDMERSSAWYTKLFGREPDDRPMESLVQWRENGGLQLWKDDERAGNSFVTLVVPSMSSERARLERAGLALGPEQPGGGGIIAQIDDPDGNRLTLAEPPKD